MKNNKGFYILIAVILIGVLVFSFFGNDILGNKTKDVEYSEFLEVVGSGEIDKVYIEGNYLAYGIKVTPEGKELILYTTRIASREQFTEVLNQYNIKIDLDNPLKWAWLQNILPTVVLVGGIILLFVLMKNMQGGGKIVKSKARVTDNIKVRFLDVAGAEEEKEELEEIVEFLKSPKKFQNLGARIPRGVLLVGPPGTGKTLFAKAVAGEANVPFFTISGSDFVEMYVGVGASRVRELFEQAKKNMPCIIFIDEIDAVGRHRGAGMGGGNDEREQTLNQLLVEMDGFETNTEIIIMAATNRADVLDPALLRPGRFDRQIVVNTPDVKGREAIFKVHARNKPIGKDVSFKELSRITVGFTGADIANLLNEAAILATRKNQKTITMVDVNEAINKVIMGPQKKSRIVTAVDKRITAYHEAGHAIVACAMKGNDPVHEVSIIPRGMAAGYTMTRPENDDNHMSKLVLYDKIAMILGGRAAEEVVIKDICTGAESDLQRATSIARAMVCEWGMSEKVGLIYLSGGKELFLGRDYQSRTSYSEELGSLIDSEIKRILTESYDKAVALLTEKRNVLDNMARVLIEKETIYEKEVRMLMDGKTVDEVYSYLKNIEAEQDKNKATKEVTETFVDEKKSTPESIVIQPVFEEIKKAKPEEISKSEKEVDEKQKNSKEEEKQINKQVNTEEKNKGEDK